MEIFKCTLNDGTQDTITTDGATLSIVDNSNYRNHSNLAQGGGANYITLADTESDWNDFFVDCEFAIIGGTGVGQRGYCTTYTGSTKKLEVNVTLNPVPDTTSVYELGERGHLKSYFTDFRQLFIKNPSGTTALLETPTIAYPYNANLPITDTYTLPDGDGVYDVTLASVPTWSSQVEYLNINAPYVWHGGVLYKNIADSTNNTPVSSPTYWTPLSSWTSLPDKYHYDAHIAVYCDILQCYLSSVFIAETKSECLGCNAEMFMRDPYIQKALKMKPCITAIPYLVNDNDWDRVRNIINYAKNICCGCK